jgi:hypothetical protein
LGYQHPLSRLPPIVLIRPNLHARLPPLKLNRISGHSFLPCHHGQHLTETTKVEAY